MSERKMVWGITSQGLHKHYIFWGCVVIPPLIAICLLAFFRFFCLDLSLTPEGVSYFYDKAKFIILVATLSIPLGATFSRMHSAEQTSTSLRIVEDKNNKEWKASFRSDFLNLMGVYENNAITFTRGDVYFSSSCLPSPVKTFNFFFKRKDYLYAKNVVPSIRLFIVAGVNLRTVLEMESRKEGLSLLQFAKQKSHCFIDFSHALHNLSVTCGAREVLVKGKKPISGYKEEELPDCFAYFDRGTLAESWDESQQKALGEVESNAKMALCCYYYSSQIATELDDEYSDLLWWFSKYLYLVSRLVNPRVGLLGSDNAADYCEQWGELGDFDRHMLLFWGGEFLSEEREKEIKAALVHHEKRLLGKLNGLGELGELGIWYENEN